jgi:hypothetical protein
MAASTYLAQVQQLYIAYFGRPADPIGQAYWAGIIDAAGGSIAAVQAGFSASTESQALYGNKSTIDKVTAIYNNVFNRAPDAAGLAFWVAQIDSGKVSQAQASWTIQQNAGAGDAATVQNKLTAAQAFTAQIDTSAEISGYQGTAAAASGRTFLNTVTSDNATATAAVAGAAGAVLTATSVGVVGTTFTLTTGVDALVGTANADTFNAVIGTTTPTLTVVDSINGGAGNDVLNITVTEAVALPAASITGVETINVRAVAALNSSDLSAVSGLTNFNVDRSTANVTTTNLAKGAAYGVLGDGSSTSAATYALGYAATADVATLNISGGTKGTAAITLSGTGLTSTVINSTGTAANTVGAITALGTAVTINASANLTGTLVSAAATTLTVNGTGVVDLSAATLSGTVATVNAAANTGGVKVTANGLTTFKFVGGTGNDQVTTGGTLATGASVDAGAGTADRLVVAVTGDLTTASGLFYKGFEQVQANDGVTVDVSNLSVNNTINTVVIADAGGATGVTNLTAAQAAAVQITSANAAGAITIGVSGASNGGQIDTVKAALTTTTAAGVLNAIDLTGLSLVGVEKLELTGNGTVGATTGGVTLTTSAATSLDSIILKNAGINSITISGTHTATNLSVDASGSTGATTIDASAYNVSTGATLKGGSGNDTITGSAKADVLTGGAGNDTFAFGTGGSVIGTATDIITDFGAKTATAGDIISFGAAVTILAADSTALVAGSGGGSNVQTTAGGKVVFAAADNTLALKIAAVQADTQLKAAGTVAFFEDAGNTYVFSAGALATTADDQLIQLTGVTGLNTLALTAPGASSVTIAA